MKTLAFAAALLLSGTAFAQDTTTPPVDPASPPDTTVPAAPMPAEPMTAPVPAAPAMAPMVAQPGPPAPASYPRCSRTITDGCVQDQSRESDTKGGAPARKRRPRG